MSDQPGTVSPTSLSGSVSPSSQKIDGSAFPSDQLFPSPTLFPGG